MLDPSGPSLVDDSTLRETLLDIIESMELAIKAEIKKLEVPGESDKVRAPANDDLTRILSMCETLQKKCGSLQFELGKVQLIKERAEHIRQLEACLKNREEHIVKLENEIRVTEFMLTTRMYEAEQRLISLNRDSIRPVNSEDIIRLAHQISRSYSVAAPLSWQTGDSLRPFPAEAEIRLSRLANSPPLQNVTPSGASGSKPFGPGQTPVTTPTMRMGASGSPTANQRWATDPSSPRQQLTAIGTLARTSSTGSPTGGRNIPNVRINFNLPPSHDVPPPISNIGQMSSDDSSASSDSDDDSDTDSDAYKKKRKK